MRRFLATPVDIASLAAFRVLYGLLMAVAMVRLYTTGWLDELYLRPAFTFKYWGAAWAVVPPRWALLLLVGALVVCALALALGRFARAAALLFFLGFGYLELLDVTNYLNHYYLAALLALLLAIPSWANATVPRWLLWLFRFQIAVVYVNAGLAKLSADWLLAAQPLSIWLQRHAELPFLGERWVAFVASWAAFLYDTTIPLWLSLRRTRVFAFAAVVVFHASTHLLFNIGMFPFLMTAAATLFFAPEWPRRFFRRKPEMPATTSRVPLLAIALYAALQIFLPLRHFLYPGDVAWNEEGMRFGWKVLMRDKQGSVTFHVHLPDGKRVEVPPGRYLDRRQEREMSGQPDLILQLAHHIAAEYRARGLEVAVTAETHVSWNGRPPAPLVDPTRDLTKVEDGLAPKDWLLPAPDAAPLWSRR
jgi:hypothetical protein